MYHSYCGTHRSGFRAQWLVFSIYVSHNIYKSTAVRWIHHIKGLQYGRRFHTMSFPSFLYREEYLFSHTQRESVIPATVHILCPTLSYWLITPARRPIYMMVSFCCAPYISLLTLAAYYPDQHDSNTMLTKNKVHEKAKAMFMQRGSTTYIHGPNQNNIWEGGNNTTTQGFYKSICNIKCISKQKYLYIHTD